MFSLIYVWINRNAGVLRRCRAHYDVTVMMMEQAVEIHIVYIHQNTNAPFITCIIFNPNMDK